MNIIKVFFVSVLDSKIASLVVEEGSGREDLMGETKEATIQLEVT